MKKGSYHIYAFITILGWSLAYVFTRMLLPYYSAFPLGFMRYFVASLTLLIIVFVMKIKPPKIKDIPMFILSGALGFFFYMITFNKGHETVSAATGSVIIATVPLITALFASFIYKEKLKAFQWIAILIEFSGVIVLTLLSGAFTVNKGMLWVFFAAFGLASYNLIQRKLTKTYTALTSTAYSIFAGTLLLAIFSPKAIEEASQASPISFVYLIIMGVFSSAIAYVSWSKAFTKAEKTSQVSNYMFITPFLTSIFGVLLAKEIPDKATILGGAIILFGVLIFNFGEKLVKTKTR